MTSGDPAPEQQIEVLAALDLLRAVRVLHERGYQLLRIVPGMSPTGLFWRCTLVPAGGISRNLAARYTSADGTGYFGSGSTTLIGPERLADLVAERFPELLAAAEGHDPDYAAWYRTMLEVAESGFFPLFYDDAELPTDRGELLRLPGTGEPPLLDLPPPAPEP